MKAPLRLWQLVTLLVFLCLATLAIVSQIRSGRRSTPAQLVRYLPDRPDGFVLFLDVDALRRGGVLDLLAGSRAVEEENYTAFVQETGFDYRLDLDLVVALLQSNSVHILLRGRFDWTRLTGYARKSRGTCWNGFCSMPANDAKRTISFFALRNDVLALAVGGGKYEAQALAEPVRPESDLSGDPVWLKVPTAALTSGSLPAGTRTFATAVRAAREIQLSLGVDRGRFRLSLDVDCEQPDDATRIAAELESATETLRRFIAREGKSPNPHDLSGVLTAGTFLRNGNRVQGQWPIAREFLRAIATGTL
ncbi:MAG: hypothetical protein ACRD44_14480 [Bryobacteraceae bacterium]